jgi:hypothetical protein
MVNEVYSRDTNPEWLSEKSLFLKWKDDSEACNKTLHFVATGEATVVRGRRAIDLLQKRLQAWMCQTEDFPTAGPELKSVATPVFPEITSTLAVTSFRARSIFVAAVQLACYAAVIGFGIRLSLSGIVYMAALTFLCTLLDESPKAFKRSQRVTHVVPFSQPSETGTYQRGSWRDVQETSGNS